MPQADFPPVRRGAVAIIRREGKCLVIQRAAGVEAPGAYCFPGGGIEPGESEYDALCRELREELGVQIVPRQRVWQSETSWGVALAWWTADLETGQTPHPDPAEVAGFVWIKWDDLRLLPGLLESNLALLEAVSRGDVVLDRWNTASAEGGTVFPDP